MKTKLSYKVRKLFEAGFLLLFALIVFLSAFYILTMSLFYSVRFVSQQFIDTNDCVSMDEVARCESMGGVYGGGKCFTKGEELTINN